MAEVQPALPVYAVVLYFVFAFLALLLCLTSLAAIVKTKKTPYSTKVLCLCLLAFDSLFLIFSSVSRLFKYNDLYVIQHITRGLHVSSYIIVGSMALERLLVLNWTYLYLRLNTKRRTRIICIGIFVGSILHYSAVRAFACYIKNKPVDCGMGIQVYFFVISVSIPILSYISYGKIYTIVRQKTADERFKYRLTHYKGTLVSFLYLVNTTINLLIYLGLSTFYLIRSKKGVKEDGIVATMTDSVNIINCIADPLIYVILFKETRLEMLKMVGKICPFVRPKIQTMHMEIFDIITSSTRTH